jgi:LysR family transcriptional activator of nhaA
MQGLNYNHLRYFWEVARDGNLTRTAERLNLSQSALSVQIRTLEERLGHALFERRSRQLHLTEAGRIALDHADTIFAAGRDLVATLAREGAARQVLRVGAAATLSRNFQMAFLRPLLDLPDVELVLRAGSPADLLQGLETLALDVVLTNRAPSPDALSAVTSHPLSEQPVSLIGTAARVGRAPEMATLLATQPVIVPTLENPMRAALDSLWQRLGVTPILAAEVDDMAMMRLLAREDAGLAFLPPIVVRDELQSGLLVEVAQTGVTERFYALTRQRKFPNPLLETVLAAHPI